MRGEDLGRIHSRVYRILEKTPLCPSCLGRLFAARLRGYSNRERGLALMRGLVMELEQRAEEGDGEARRMLERIAPGLPPEFDQSLERLGIKVGERTPCWLCGGRLEEWLGLHRRASELVRSHRAESFVVGVVLSKALSQREDELLRTNMVTTGESIRQEVKREIGKRVMAETGVPVDFERPGVTIMVTLPQGIVYARPNPILVKGRYLKTGRNISQTRWTTRRGERRFELSVQDMLEPLREALGGAELVLHASGREDTDARMLGDGRPMVVEVKEPQRRRTSLPVVEKLLNTRARWGWFALEGPVTRDYVRELKTSDQHRMKAYRALVTSDRPLNPRELEEAEKTLNGVEIRQRTPQRVSHRRADVVRVKRLYETRLVQLAPRLLQAYFLAEGGLYIKELVSGDDGRTQPSLASVLGAGLQCVELDVLWVEAR